ncbi:uncharacterized protein LOC143041537 [Oratosquilla oratoria]|uniref:uncharacterized protein LOC143041537 n=1 Tax=Oratosquilla oratoria TaxID=337810 RepID=UPI003F75E215
MDLSSDNSSSASEHEEEASTKSRKRQRCPDKWIKNQNKAKCNRGEAYTSHTTKKKVGERRVGSPCSCPAKCFTKIGDDNVEAIFKAYWDLANHDAQSNYLAFRVVETPVKRPRKKQDGSTESKRQCTRNYSVLVSGMVVTVCKTAFLNIHGISDKRVRNVSVKTKASPTGTPTADKRGSIVKWNQVADVRKDLVHNFIKALPLCSSHYSRTKAPNRKYLPPGSTLISLYKAYKDDLEEKQLINSVVHEHMFRDIFNSEFNISTTPPQADTCNFCDEYAIKFKMLMDEKNFTEKEILKAQKTVHDTHAKVAQRLLKAYGAEKTPKISCIAIELQQTLPTPRLTSGAQY